MMMNITKEALSIDEAREIAGIGRTKLYELIGAGDLKARRIGRRTLVLRGDLMTFLNGLPSIGKEKP